MEPNQIATLSLNVNSSALKSVIASGRLLEFADTVATQAAAQIAAQLVQHVAEGAVNKSESAAVTEVSYFLVTGDGEPGFGTSPHPPHWVVTSVDNLASVALREVAAAAGAAGE